MNNEVLRRKMFRTVLADSRAPAGILASSPEMVDTVSRRANGGLKLVEDLQGSSLRDSLLACLKVVANRLRYETSF